LKNIINLERKVEENKLPGPIVKVDKLPESLMGEVNEIRRNLKSEKASQEEVKLALGIIKKIGTCFGITYNGTAPRHPVKGYPNSRSIKWEGNPQVLSKAVEMFKQVGYEVHMTEKAFSFSSLSNNIFLQQDKQKE
jgi:hypothetical protein